MINSKAPFLRKEHVLFKYPILHSLYFYTFNKFLLNTYSVIITVLGIEKTIRERPIKHKIPVYTELTVQLSLNLEFVPGLFAKFLQKSRN